MPGIWHCDYYIFLSFVFIQTEFSSADVNTLFSFAATKYSY